MIKFEIYILEEAGNVFTIGCGRGKKATALELQTARALEETIKKFTAEQTKGDPNSHTVYVSHDVKPYEPKQQPPPV